ncbi:MAG: alkaline phosphatase family protein [Solirubrobacteraceae bacterium]
MARPASPSPSERCARGLTRRSVLAGAAGGAALLAGGGLPAWARPVARVARATGAGQAGRAPDSLPFPHLPAGTPSMPELEHIVVLMMENHTFDNLLGMVPYEVPGREGVDGLTRTGRHFADFNRAAGGHRVYARSAASPCQQDGVPTQSWNASHQSYDGGRNDGFVRASGPVAMQFWDQHELPFTYSLVKHFPLGERYFSSVLAQTYPNRRFMFTGTASGTTATNNVTFNVPAANGTIWDRLDAHQIDWRIYYQSAPSALIVPGFYSDARKPRIEKMDAFYTAAAAGALPAYTFLDPQYSTTSEENPQDIQVGERFVASVVNALLHSPGWKRTALFITYDEGGGYYDHVPPPRAIKPDSTPPIPVPGNVPGAYDRYGFRVPTIVVSPWARAGYVSRRVQDHTSILAFVERKWNLPAMTYRDANAQPMTDYFDFRHAAFAQPPELASGPGLGPGLKQCTADGLHPPLPGMPSPPPRLRRRPDPPARRS